jgi:RNA recognition motif-containing protein
MQNKLFAVNFPADVAENQLRELFGQYGPVQSIELGVIEKTGERGAVVEMGSEKVATKANHGLNGLKLGDQYLVVSYLDADTGRELTPKQRKIIEEIAAALGETEEVPRRQIEAVVTLCGTSFAQTILAETLEIAAAGSLAVSDGSRPRTPGGIFFYLVRFRVSPEVRRWIYNRKGKLVEEKHA